MTWIALLLLANGELWVTTSGFDSPACGDQSLVGVLHVLRPHIVLHAGAASGTGMRATLEHAGNANTLRLVGPDRSIVRVFADQGDCRESLRTGALIIDAAFDEALKTGDTPRLDTLPARPGPAPPAGHALTPALALTGGVEQGPLGVAPVFGVELQARRGLLDLALSGELVAPETSSHTGSFTAIGGSAEALAGVAPRLGPGWLNLDAGGGGAAVTGSLTELGSLFHLQSVTGVQPFATVRAGYSFKLPRRFFVAARLEERFAFTQTVFTVEGIGKLASTPQWTLVAALAVGWSFW